MAIANFTASSIQIGKLSKRLFDNPGSLYNLGNGIALAAGLLDCVAISNAVPHTTLAAMNSYFFGNWPAIFTSLAVIFFFVSGQKYASAWANGFPPNEKDNNMGDGLSAIGAVLIGFGLIGFARNTFGLSLAIITTVLHAAGKLGSFAHLRNQKVFKILPMLSRSTYIASLTSVVSVIVQAGGLVHAVVPIALIVAAMVWARADWLLCPKSL